jgi:hypothetical protein
VGLKGEQCGLHGERAMDRATSIRTRNDSCPCSAAPWRMFGPGRRLLSAADSRQVMVDCFAVWNEITGATTTAAA